MKIRYIIWCKYLWLPLASKLAQKAVELVALLAEWNFKGTRPRIMRRVTAGKEAQRNMDGLGMITAS